ncbi:hypothetical protein [Methylosinus sp. PW1]|uniref:hypothetical protein n=1 Tax=Methylosinus sp. PW1 TaxID=107636 RepID=UPI000562B071|nr:hypothetical protein [Methylosinus sp. PW1]
MRTSDDRLFDKMREKLESLTGERADGTRRALLVGDLTSAKNDILATTGLSIDKINAALASGLYLTSNLLAAAGNFVSGSTGKILTADIVWGDAAEKTITVAGTTYTPDFGAGINFLIAGPTSDFTLANPTNAKVGQCGTIRIVQDSVGSRLCTLGSYWKTAFSVPIVLSTSPYSVDLLSYKVITSTFIQYSLAKSVG